MIKHISHESIQKWLGKSQVDNLPSKSQAFQRFISGHQSKYQRKDQLLVTPWRVECEENYYYQQNHEGKQIRYGDKQKKYLKTIHRAEQNLQIEHINPLTPYVSPSFQLTSSFRTDKFAPQNIECKKNCCLHLQRKYSQEIKYLTMNNQQLYEQVQLLSSQIRSLEDNIKNLKVENDNLSNNNQKLRAKIKNIVKSFNQIKQKCLEMQKQSLKEKQCQIADNFKEIQIIEKIALSHRKQKQNTNKELQSNSTNRKHMKRAKTQYYDKNNNEGQYIVPLLTWQDTSQTKITPNKSHQIPKALTKTKFSSTDMTTKESLKLDRYKNLSKYSPNILEKEINKCIGKLSKQKNIILKEIGQNQKTVRLKLQIQQYDITRKNSNVKEKSKKKMNHEKYTSFFPVASISSNKNTSK